MPRNRPSLVGARYEFLDWSSYADKKRGTLWKTLGGRRSKSYNQSGMNVRTRIRELKESDPRITLSRIAAQLNEEEIASPGGGKWWPSTVATELGRMGLDSSRQTFSDSALGRILELKSPEVAMGLAEIGETLTREGIPTPQGGKWWPATVRKVLENAAQDGNTRATEALERPANRKIGQYGGGKVTPDAILGRIVELRRAGTALHEIAEILTKEGVPTTRGGRRWWQSTVRSALAAAGYTEQPELDV